MPNGGSDCCGTCWFNLKNKGEVGYAHATAPDPAFCTIRHFPIEDPFYTYCVNHPDCSPERDPIPIGPVFRGDSSGARKFWAPSPDTEEIRDHLLMLIRFILTEPRSPGEHPVYYNGDLVVWQLGEFREQRAIEELTRIASFDPSTGESRSIKRTQHLAELAREALSKIKGGQAAGS